MDWELLKTRITQPAALLILWKISQTIGVEQMNTSHRQMLLSRLCGDFSWSMNRRG